MLDLDNITLTVENEMWEKKLLGLGHPYIECYHTLIVVIFVWYWNIDILSSDFKTATDCNWILIISVFFILTMALMSLFSPSVIANYYS